MKFNLCLLFLIIFAAIALANQLENLEERAPDADALASPLEERASDGKYIIITIKISFYLFFFITTKTCNIKKKKKKIKFNLFSIIFSVETFVNFFEKLFHIFNFFYKNQKNINKKKKKKK